MNVVTVLMATMYPCMSRIDRVHMRRVYLGEWCVNDAKMIGLRVDVRSEQGLWGKEALRSRRKE